MREHGETGVWSKHERPVSVCRERIGPLAEIETAEYRHSSGEITLDDLRRQIYGEEVTPDAEPLDLPFL
jgi:hypothetical protein